MNPLIETTDRQRNQYDSSDNFLPRRRLLNTPVIKQLVYKDWYLNRRLIATYIGGAIFALSIISLGDWQFYMGAILLMSMMIGLGNHQLGTTMINERKEQTLSFVMSLPVSPADYAMAKFLSNLAIFVVPWLILTALTTGVILLTPLPDGFLTFALLVCVLILLNHCISWCVAMVTASEGAILIIMIGLNCLLNPALYVIANFPEIGGYTQQPEFIWSDSATFVLLAQVLAIVLLLFSTMCICLRKKVFF